MVLTAHQKSHPDHICKRELPRILAMTDNYPRNSLRSFARDIGMSEFYFCQPGIAGRRLFFSIQYEKRITFIIDHKGKRTYIHVKLLNKVRNHLHRMYFDFSQMTKILPGSNGEFIELLHASSVPTICTDSDENQVFS